VSVGLSSGSAFLCLADFWPGTESREHKKANTKWQNPPVPRPNVPYAAQKGKEFEKSTYAMTHAARLERLSRKLAIIAQAPSQAVLPTGLSNTSSEMSQQGREIVEGEDEQGWSLFALLGLIDPDEIAAFGPPLSSSYKRGSRRRPSSSSSESGSDADWIRGLSAVAWRHLSESPLLESFS
jgi:hypothetical protein